jgi:nitrogen regulatory protein PII
MGVSLQTVQKQMTWEEALSHMKMLMIVARDSMMSELEKILPDNGVNAYSIINKVVGKGRTGQVHESFFDTGYTGFNFIILAILPSDQVDRVVSALKAFIAARVKGAHGELIPFKLFSFPCEELM